MIRANRTTMPPGGAMDINALLAALKPAEPAAEYCLLWIQWWPLCMTKAEWSGWVQAIGSILAIAAGVAVVKWEFQQQRATRAGEERHRLETLAGLAFFAGMDVAQVDMAMTRLLYAPGSVRTLRRRLGLLREMPLIDIPDAASQDAFIELQAAIAEFELRIDEAETTKDGTALELAVLSAGEFLKRLREVVEKHQVTLTEKIEALQRAVGKAIERRGGTYPTWSKGMDGFSKYFYTPREPGGSSNKSAVRS